MNCAFVLHLNMWCLATAADSCQTETEKVWSLSLFPAGCALVDMGEAMRQMADVKDSLDINVKQNFIDPLQNLQDKDLKEITVHSSSLCD